MIFLLSRFNRISKSIGSITGGPIDHFPARARAAIKIRRVAFLYRRVGVFPIQSRRRRSARAIIITVLPNDHGSDGNDLMTTLCIPIRIAFVLSLAASSPLEPLGKLDHPAIREASGIVASRLHPGVFWVHNDSGNESVLFAVRRDGKLVREFKVAAPNVDWEDIATDDHGKLYIADTGNNHELLPSRAVYVVDEPDPDSPGDQPLKTVRAIHYRFEKKRRFDCESLYIWKDRAYLITKRYDGREAERYSIAVDSAAPIFKPLIPRYEGTLAEFTEPATGADLSADGRRLAVCSLKSARVYEIDPESGPRPISFVRYDADQVEAICWDGDDLLLANEQRGMFRIAASTWRPKSPLQSAVGERCR